MRAIPWLTMLAACPGGSGTETDDPCLPEGEPSLAIGLGLDGYTALPDGGEFPLVHGPQGWFHLEIGRSAAHLDVSDLVTGHLVGSIDGVVYAEAAPWLDFRCDLEEDAQLSWGTRLIYDAPPEFLDGQPTAVTAEVTDVRGITVRTSSTFTIRDDG